MSARGLSTARLVKFTALAAAIAIAAALLYSSFYRKHDCSSQVAQSAALNLYRENLREIISRDMQLGVLGILSLGGDFARLMGRQSEAAVSDSASSIMRNAKLSIEEITAEESDSGAHRIECAAVLRVAVSESTGKSMEGKYSVRFTVQSDANTGKPIIRVRW